MKKFSYVCEFIRKDFKHPDKPISIERHLFVFLVHTGEPEKKKKSGRFIEEWDPFGFEDEPDESE